MSDMSVSSAASSTQLSQWAQRKTLFDQLGQALQKGDLQGAQTAFAALQKSAPGLSASQSGQGNASQSPFTALADALQKGDLAGAQQAFSQIQQARGHHHHHRPLASSSAGGTSAAATTSSNSSASSTPGPVEITININGGNNIIA